MKEAGQPTANPTVIANTQFHNWLKTEVGKSCNDVTSLVLTPRPQEFLTIRLWHAFFARDTDAASLEEENKRLSKQLEEKDREIAELKSALGEAAMFISQAPKHANPYQARMQNAYLKCNLSYHLGNP